MFECRNVLVAYDFSAHARRALETAVTFAKRQSGDCTLLHVVQSYPFMAFGGVPSHTTLPPPNAAAMRDDAVAQLEQVAASVQDAPGRIDTRVVEDSDVAGAICEIAQELDADLIVMGTHGRTGIAHAIVGSIAERTLRHAPCSVLTVRAEEDEDDPVRGAPRQSA